MIGSMTRITGKVKMVDKAEPASVARKIESLFLGEFLKMFLKEADFADDSAVSAMMPMITSGLADHLAKEGIGIGDFLKGQIDGTQEGK